MPYRFSDIDAFDSPLNRQMREIEVAHRRFEDVINPPGLGALMEKIDRAQSIFDYLERHQSLLDEINRPQGLAAKVAEPQGLAAKVAEMERLADPLRETMRAAGLDLESSLTRAQDIFERKNPAAEALAAIESRHSAISALEERVAGYSAAAKLEESFRRPEMRELASIAEAGMSASRIAGDIFKEQSRLEAALARIEKPWADIEAMARSAGAIADINAISDLLRVRDPFESEVLASLRPSLGDWRHTVIPAPSELASGGARREFYVAQGYDPALGNFPEEAFREIFDDADLWDAFEDAADDDPVAEIAFRMLRKFERELREFIDRTLTNEFGADWISLLPADMRENWEDKKKRKLKAGRQVPSIIFCADFADYRMIIENRTFWPAFRRVFRVKNGVQEALGRLAPVRIATMHAEDLTLDDAAIILTEAAFIRRAMKAH